MSKLNSVELFALQVLLAKTIESTPSDASIFNSYNKLELYVGIMEKLCPVKTIIEGGMVN